MGLAAVQLGTVMSALALLLAAASLLTVTLQGQAQDRAADRITRLELQVRQLSAAGPPRTP